jgi:high-affinity K+ transport system ATPase subunit B
MVEEAEPEEVVNAVLNAEMDAATFVACELLKLEGPLENMISVIAADGDVIEIEAEIEDWLAIVESLPVVREFGEEVQNLYDQVAEGVDQIA